MRRCTPGLKDKLEQTDTSRAHSKQADHSRHLGSKDKQAISGFDEPAQEDDPLPAYSLLGRGLFDAKLSYTDSLIHAFKHSLNKKTWFSQIAAIE